MERPFKIPDSVRPYVEYLESTIEEFKTHTKKKFYRGIQRQLDLLGDEMLDESFVVSMKSSYELRGEKYIKVDNGFEGFFDMMTKGEAIVKAMEKFETQALPKEQKQSEKKSLSEDSAENFMKPSEKK